jgi:hypothetical protein
MEAANKSQYRNNKRKHGGKAASYLRQRKCGMLMAKWQRIDNGGRREGGRRRGMAAKIENINGGENGESGVIVIIKSNIRKIAETKKNGENEKKWQ